MLVYLTGIFFITQLHIIFGNESRLVQMETISKECAKEYNIKNYFMDSKNVSRDYKCYITCTFTKLGYVDADGNTNVAGIKEDYIVEDADLEAIAICAEENANDDLCEKVFMTQTCNMVYFDAKQIP